MSKLICDHKLPNGNAKGEYGDACRSWIRDFMDNAHEFIADQDIMVGAMKDEPCNDCDTGRIIHALLVYAVRTGVSGRELVEKCEEWIGSTPDSEDYEQYEYTDADYDADEQAAADEDAANWS